MPVWSIKIVPSPSGQPAAFQPDLPNAKPGDPLKALNGDLVTWNNTTDETYQPWPTDSNGTPLAEEPNGPVGPRGSANYLSDPIPGQAASRPSWTVTPIISGQNTIYYCIKTLPQVRGTIEITG